jgi:endonuclease-3 related protein
MELPVLDAHAERMQVGQTAWFDPVRPASLKTEPSAAPLAAPSVAPSASRSAELLRYFESMSQTLGPMHWWPARTPFEVIVGAILTQSTSWTNVEKAVGNLRAARMLTPAAIRKVPTSRLAELVRPSGYFRQKAKKLKAFSRFLQRQHGGSLQRMFKTPLPELRESLLSVHGIGPETADSILLYAGNQPVFVVDSYTHRIFARHGITAGKPNYEAVRAMFESALPREPGLLNEYHALIVNTGKQWCRKSAPRCESCPLRHLLPAGAAYARTYTPLSSITPREVIA